MQERKSASGTNRLFVLIFLVTSAAAAFPLPAESVASTNLSDKDAHFTGGLVSSLLLFGYLFTVAPELFHSHPVRSTDLFGLGIGLFVGTVKEIADGFRPGIHRQELIDIVATGLGGWMGGILAGEILALTRTISEPRQRVGALRPFGAAITIAAFTLAIPIYRMMKSDGSERADK